MALYQGKRCAFAVKGMRFRRWEYQTFFKTGVALSLKPRTICAPSFAFWTYRNGSSHYGAVERPAASITIHEDQRPMQHDQGHRQRFLNSVARPASPNGLLGGYAASIL
ncbi:MAG: hypothetical protein LBK67_03355 [Coriobacteriales bacterium]|jgi:hypothetical protein|nr:hypothetical protein [Coriobacteriales bacterium]